MGPDPFSAPGFGGAQNFGGMLQEEVNQAAPLAPSWHGQAGQIGGVQVSQAMPKAAAPPKSGGVLSQFAHFIGGVASETGHIASSAASWLGHQLVDIPMGFSHLATGIDHGIQDRLAINKNMALTQQSSDKLDMLASEWKSGRITKSQYQSGLKDITAFNQQITSSEQSLDGRIKQDQNQTIQAAISVASTVVALMTGGLGRGALIGAEGIASLGNKSAADWLAGKAGGAYLSAMESKIGQVAGDSTLFKALTPAAQAAVQKATAEVIAQNAGRMTAAQIARGAAANLALKYPLTYNALSSTGNGIYHALDNKQYGSAVQQLALNALFLTAGGPIGHALQKGGGALKGALFGEGSFIDELSKGIGDGNPAGLYNAIMKLPEDQRGEVVQNLSAVAATNMSAVAGHDTVAAARRVLDGMANYEGISMSSFTHEEALNNMVNFAKAQRIADTVAKDKGLGNITVGRVDVAAKNYISAQLSPLIEGSSKDGAHNAWDALRAENPNAAWANNENFDRQVNALIDKHNSAGGFDEAMRNIKAQSFLTDFPKAQADELAKMGYIPIKPSSLEAPFREGSGKLTSGFATKGSDFFTRAVAPLPILGSVGSLLTNMGLSPQASTDRVYQMFNGNLAENLKNINFSGALEQRAGTAEETADNLIKDLSNYAHNPKGLQVAGRELPATPVTDLRQLTTRDIMNALNVSNKDAKQVRGAIMDAMLSVHLQARGLGDKLVDVAYKVNPLQAKFMRIQGAARFAWNPFFQAKLAYKTELLTQLDSSGHFLTTPGMNTVLSTIFPDKYRQLDQVRGILRDAGMFEERTGGSLTGEAVDSAGLATPNLSHKLLDSQERSIAAMISVQADRVGLPVNEFVKNFQSEVSDTIRAIAQYDRRSDFLNSPLARTLNLAFFPFRFETKVATFMARSLSKQGAVTQLAVLNGLYRAHDWMNSAEGQAWYSKNSEAIGLIKYFTPVQTLSEVGTLLGMHPDSIGSFGELGGLPFGWIPQLLDAEGLTHFGGAYVSPKTGEVIPSYIPTTTKGQLAAAIQDLIGALYTYPGAQAGLPSKTSLDRNIALGVTGASKKTDFTQETPQMSPAQMKFSDAVKAANPTPSLLSSPQQAEMQAQNISKTKQPTPSVQPNQTVPGTTVPTQPDFLPGKQSKSRAGSGGTKRTKGLNTNGTPKLKKSQFKPALLPGQTQYGQL